MYIFNLSAYQSDIVDFLLQWYTMYLGFLAQLTKTQFTKLPLFSFLHRYITSVRNTEVDPQKLAMQTCLPPFSLFRRWWGTRRHNSSRVVLSGLSSISPVVLIVMKILCRRIWSIKLHFYNMFLSLERSCYFFMCKYFLKNCLFWQLLTGDSALGHNKATTTITLETIVLLLAFE